MIAELDPIRRKSVQIDRYVARTLVALMRKRHGRNLRPASARHGTRERFEGHGLIRLRGTIRFAVAAS